jgi:hypothetical protein
MDSRLLLQMDDLRMLTPPLQLILRYHREPMPRFQPLPRFDPFPRRRFPSKRLTPPLSLLSRLPALRR